MTVHDRTAKTKLRLRIQDGQVVSETGEVYDLHEAVKGIPWVTAVQYPPPHQYVIFDRCPSVPWEVVNCVIHKHPDSYLAYFRGYRFPMRYFEFEGRRYWRSSSRGPGKKVTHMLNRCLLTDVEPPRRVDQGAKPRHDWNGPPWMPEGSPWPEWFVKGPDGKYHYKRELDPMWGKQKRGIRVKPIEEKPDG